MSTDERLKMNVRFPVPVMRALGRSAKLANRSANEQAVRFISDALIQAGLLVVEPIGEPEVLPTR